MEDTAWFVGILLWFHELFFFFFVTFGLTKIGPCKEYMSFICPGFFWAN